MLCINETNVKETVNHCHVTEQYYTRQKSTQVKMVTLPLRFDICV